MPECISDLQQIDIVNINPKKDVMSPIPDLIFVFHFFNLTITHFKQKA